MVDQISLALVSLCGAWVPFNPKALLCAKSEAKHACVELELKCGNLEANTMEPDNDGLPNSILKAACF